jgi:rubredoxin
MCQWTKRIVKCKKCGYELDAENSHAKCESMVKKGKCSGEKPEIKYESERDTDACPECTKPKPYAATAA